MRGVEKLPCTLSGTWDKDLHVCMPNGAKRKLWHIYPMPKAESRQGSPPPPSLSTPHNPCAFSQVPFTLNYSNSADRKLGLVNFFGDHVTCKVHILAHPKSQCSCQPGLALVRASCQSMFGHGNTEIVWPLQCLLVVGIEGTT